MNLKTRIEQLERQREPEGENAPCPQCGHNYTHQGLIFVDGQHRDVTRRCPLCGRSVERGAEFANGKAYGVFCRDTA